VFEGAKDVVQAVAAMRKHTAERARCAREASEGQACSADAVLLKEHKEMLKRYQIKLYSTAVERYGQHPSIDVQVCMRGCPNHCCSVCLEAQRYKSNADRGTMGAVCYFKEKQSQPPD
jgi:hypothetical protein